MNNEFLLDIILLPKSLYRKLKDSILTLYIGIILVGLLNTITIFLPLLQEKYINNTLEVSFYNISIFTTLVLLLGFVDVVFFSMPLFDMFLKFKSDNAIINKNGMLVRLMKVYILAHIPIAVVNIIIYILFYTDNLNSQAAKDVMDVVVNFLIPGLFSLAIVRGVKIIYNFSSKYNNILFVYIFGWSFVLSITMVSISLKWLYQLFR